MARFVYRLEKVLKYRINKKEEQLQRVIAAQRKVEQIQGEINKNKKMIVTLRQNMLTADHTMLEQHDIYIKHLYEIIDDLEIQKAKAIKKLEEEKRILEELEKSIKALEKHKEKSYERWKEEERIAEMKLMDEVGSQKHFQKMLERKEEEEIDEILNEYDY